MKTLILTLVLSLSLWLPVQATNVLTTNPIVVDTVAATALIAGYMEILCINWVGPTDATHTAVVQNAAGTVLWAGKSSTTTLHGSSMCWPADAPLKAQGLLVPTLGSGTLYIYLKGNVRPT